MLYKNSQLADYLIQLMPGLKLFPSKPQINTLAAETLYSIWENEKNRLSNKTLIKPATLAADRVDLMKREGLVRQNGNALEVTSKGQEVIKIMILGNDSSIFDEKNVSFASASENVKRASRRTKTKTAQANDLWWERFCK